MNKSFSSSFGAENLLSLETIRQSMLDLLDKPPQKEVNTILKESLSNLDKTTDCTIVNELFSLIFKSISILADAFPDILPDIIKKSRLNSNRIVFTSIFLTDDGIKDRIPANDDISLFITDSLDQIIKYLKKSNDEPLIIFNKEIPIQFKDIFFINIFLLSKINTRIIDIFNPYIFLNDNISEKNYIRCIIKVTNKGLTSSLPQSIFSDDELLLKLPVENLAIIIQNMTDQEFIKFLPAISSLVTNPAYIIRPFLNVVLDKIVEYNVVFDNVSALISLLSPLNMTDSVCDYIGKHNIVLPRTLAEHINSFPNPSSALKFLPNFKTVQREILIENILKFDDFSSYQKVFDAQHNIEIIGTSEFWIHILSIASKNECPEILMGKFNSLFRFYFMREDVFKIFIEMIFNNYPTTNSANSFLINLLNGLDIDDLNEFYEYNEFLFQKVIDYKVVPLPSFMKLFNFTLMPKIFRIYYDHPLLMYCYANSPEIENSFYFDEIQLKELKGISSTDTDLLCRYINTLDIEMITNMGEKALSLVSSALIYVRKKEKPLVVGLTPENILIFISIIFNLNDNEILTFLDDENFHLFITACNSLANCNSILQIISIDRILFKLISIDFDPKVFPLNVTNHLFSILIDIFNNDSYNASKVTLIKALALLSFNNNYQKQTKIIFSHQGTSFINYIIKNMSKIKNFNTIKVNFNLQVFNRKEIETIFIDNIEHSASPEIAINTIKAIVLLFEGNINKKITDFSNLYIALSYCIDNKEWDDALLLGQFMTDNGLEKALELCIDKKIPYHIKSVLFENFENVRFDFDEILSLILGDPHPEQKDYLFDILFNELMKEESIAINYIIVLFEKVTKEKSVERSFFLKMFSKEYKEYGNLFILALRQCFTYNVKSKTFVRKINDNNIYLPQSEKGIYLVNYLYNLISGTPDYYQAYYCLLNLASVFPFLFADDPIKLFEVCLQSFDFFLIYNDYKNCYHSLNYESSNKLKACLLALQFLSLSLCAIQIMEAFMPWLIERIYSFSVAQITSIVFVFESILKTKKVGKIILSLFIKYNLLEILNNLLEREINGNLLIIYKINIFIILDDFYEMLYKLSKTEMIFVDSIHRIKNPFHIEFDNFVTIFPIKIGYFNFELDSPDLTDETSEFIRNAFSVESFWLSNYWFKREVQFQQNSDIKNFLLHYKNIQKQVPNVGKLKPIPKVDYVNNVKIIRYLSTQPSWIFNWFINDIQFPLLPKHNNILLSTIKKMNKINQESIDNNENEDIQNKEINLDLYFKNEYCNKELFKKIINEVIHTIENQNLGDEDVNSTINLITQKETCLQLFNKLIEEMIEEHKNDLLSTNVIKGLVHAFVLISKKKLFKKYFNENCLNDLITLSLSPKYREDNEFLLYFTKLLNVIDVKLPESITFLISIIIYKNDEKLVSQALKLVNKFEEKQLTDVMTSIDNVFEYSLVIENYHTWFIKRVLEINQSLFKSKKMELLKFFNQIKIIYLTSETKEDDLIDIFCGLFNFFASQNQIDMNSISSKKDSIFSVSSNEINLVKSDFVVNESTHEIAEKNPKFWSFYDQHIKIINDIISSDVSKLGKMKFLFEFPQLVNFQTRLEYFKQKMSKSINLEKTTSFTVDRMNVLTSTFNKLSKLDEELLNDLRISFIGENGLDYGGLTNEFFTLITTEIFDPKNKLFILTEAKNYSLNPKLNKGEEEEAKALEYFHFAGKMVALTIMHDQHINAHLMVSLCRQILHQSIKLRDVEEYDNEIYKSFQDILDNDVEPYELYFSIEIETDNGSQTVPLKNDGDMIKVTNENKFEYITLYSEYFLEKSIEKQIKAFVEGFNSLIPHEEIRLFSAIELDLLICGIQTIDIDDLKMNIVYESPYYEDHHIVKMFFNVISKWNNDDLSRLVYFITGSSKVPINGFVEYKNKGKPIRIAPGGDGDHLCVAHTCYNILNVPEYQNENQMNDKLLYSMQHCEFGLL